MSPVLSQFAIPVTSVHKVEADGVEVFYRAAGDPNAPVVLLAARISYIVVHVPRTHSTPGRPVSCDRAGLAWFWIYGST